MIASHLTALLLLATAAPPPAAIPADLSALGPATRKPKQEKADRQQIEALFQALDAALQSGDLAAYSAAMDFPLTLVTDGASGAPLVVSLDQAAFEKAVAGYLKPPPHLKVASRRTVVLLSDALAQVVDETTLTLGKTKGTSRSAAVVVRREAGWRLKVLTESGWAELLAAPAPASP